MKRKIIKRNKQQWFYLLKEVSKKKCEIKKILDGISERNSNKNN